MKKSLVAVLVLVAGVGLAGCMHEPADEAMMEQEPTMEETMEAAELTPEQAESQQVSDEDDLETLEQELDATVILEEDLSL